MATVTPLPNRIPAQTEERIHSPLHKLRGYIRRYVILEALAFFLTFCVMCFWIGLLIDYGGFRLFGFDGAQTLPAWTRFNGLLTNIVILSIVMFFKLRRLNKRFSPEGLALVLERRFPKLLGDRLITAVELADLKDADKQGYSRAMILESVDRVSKIVDQIPVKDVFNWGRLRGSWIFFGIASVGVFCVVMLTTMIVHRTANPIQAGYRVKNVATIWAERNVLIWRTLWPRRAQLELIDFPESGELRVGRDAATPRVRVRALKWVVADHAAPSNWRSMTWADLKPNLLDGRPVPTLPAALLVPPGQSAAAATDPSWTLDRVEMLLDTSEVRERLFKSGMPEPDYSALRDTFDLLGESLAHPSMHRKARKLIVPNEVRIFYWGQKIDNNMPMSRQQDANEYTAVLTDLKESVEFYVKAENFYTYPDGKITLVPPPMLTRLERDEEVPAYHYHRAPSDGKADDLKGKKQLRTGVGTSLTGSTSRIEIESGSNLTLRGTVDKDLTEVRIRYRTGKGDGKPAAVPAAPAPAPAPAGPLPAEIPDANAKPAAPAGDAKPADGAAPTGEVRTLPFSPDRRSFEMRLDNITRPIEFDFEFTDTDDVKSIRHIVIQPKDDRVPDVDLTVEVIRKTPQGYMCTARAAIPFSGRVRDDSGLSKVEYTVNYTRFESSKAAAMRAAVAAGVIGGVSPTPNPFETFSAPVLADYLGRMSESRETVVPVAPMSLQSFDTLAREKDGEFARGKRELEELLAQPPQQDQQTQFKMIRAFEIKPNVESLDLEKRVGELLKAGEGMTFAPRFRMRLTVMATDNNVETGPRTGLNKETFTFVVVPYEELLGEIAKDDEAMGVKLAEVVAKLQEAQSALEKVIERMPPDAGSELFRPAASRMTEVQEVVVKNHDVVQEVLNECLRLYKEVQTNRVPESHVNTKKDVCDRLDDALRNLFPLAEEAHAAFLRQLEDRRPADQAIIQNSRQKHRDLIEHLDRLREQLDRAGNIDKVRGRLAQLALEAEQSGEDIKKLYDDAKNAIFWELATLTLNAAPIEMQKGERRVVAVEFALDSGFEARYVVRLKAQDGSNLTLPASVNVPAKEKRFQFELVAGNTVGDFAIQLLPETPAGKAIKLHEDKPVEIKVKVK